MAEGIMTGTSLRGNHFTATGYHMLWSNTVLPVTLYFNSPVFLFTPAEAGTRMVFLT